MNTKKVLCVEDDTFFLGLITGLLEGTPGIDVVTAGTGLMGIEKAKSERPDLVLLDLMLPDIHGAEVILKIREIVGLENIPIIILSNFGDQDEVELCLKNGARAYLVKSNTLPREVAEVVISALDMDATPVVDPIIASQWPR